MTPIDRSLRDRIKAAICETLEPRSDVLAGWEGGSVAFDALDDYSDIDLNFLVVDDANIDDLYAAVELGLGIVSPITASHFAPPGRYYKLRDGGDFLLVDLSFFEVGASNHNLEVERHGQARRLFDKADWLRPRHIDERSLGLQRDRRRVELQSWFPVSQSFVRKAMLRGLDAEALAAFWSYTLRPLAEILRMRYCPIRWDFGMRYLDRDLPPAVYARFRDLMFVPNVGDLERTLAEASAWGADVLGELASMELQRRASQGDMEDPEIN